jgi:hypothetical protein
MGPENNKKTENTDLLDVLAFPGALGLAYGTGTLIHRYLVEFPQRVADKNLEELIGIVSVGVFSLALFAWTHLRSPRTKN